MTPSPRSIDLTIVRLDSVARLIVRDPELARDAVQDTRSELGAIFRACATRTGSTPGSTD